MFRNAQRFLCVALVISTIVILPGCPGAKPAPISGYTPLGNVSVMVIVPQTASVGTGTTQQFTAMINNSSVSGVQWEVDGFLGGGGDVGTIDSSGNYTAPQFVPKNPHVTITAVADADNTKSGSATITISGALPPPTVSVSPKIASVQVGKTLTFSATVLGSTDTSVTWQVNGVDDGNATVGTIMPGEKDTAVYTAPAQVPSPATVTITAISNANTTASDFAQVTISKSNPNLANVSISPTTATVQAGHGLSFTAGITGISDTDVVWEVGDHLGVPGQPGGNATVGTITTEGAYTAPTQWPPSFNPVIVSVASQSQPSRFASAVVTLTAPSINSVTISLTPSSVKNLEVGSEQVFTIVVGNTTNTSVSWEVNGVPNGNSTVGNIVPVTDNTSEVQYFAPAQVPAENPVIVKVTPDADPTISATASVNITAPTAPIKVLVSPPSANVQVGTPKQFAASVQNAADETVIWQVVPNSGCSNVGSIVASGDMGGLYSAPAVVPPSNCNPVKIEAISNQDHKTFGSATATIVNILPVQVAISPTNPSVEVNGQVNFTGTVTNAPNGDTVISDWQVNGIGQSAGGGNSTVGTIVIDSFDTATYTAPATVPSPDQYGNGHVTITAISDADSTKTASTTLTINPPPPLISVSPIQPPGPVNLLPGQSQNFSATVNGSTDQVIFWTLSGAPGGCTSTVCGSIEASTNGQPAKYTAPQMATANLTITVTATADADNTATATDSIIISENTTLSVSVSPAQPAPIAAGSSSPITFNATISNAPPDTVVDWSLGCISLWDGSHSNCLNFDNNGGPGCLEMSPTLCPTGLFASRPTDIDIPGNDTASFTAPEVLYTGTFAQNSCEETNDGSGNGQVPLTASVTYNGNVASVTVCITVTPP